jgi:hypothetical protein
MIPSTNKQLLVAEDWKKIYQSFRNADFKSYDFETLRRTMFSYLQENYPEDFNDFIDSSEYVALIDLIAYLGQNLSFRIDLNARENFLETAQRRDSVLRLAQLISYSPSRNSAANGFLKITAISTTDSVIDSNGTNLANATIGWNDTTNPEWYQQFINIMNSVMNSNFGTPEDKSMIGGIDTEQYRINNVNDDVSIFSFSKNINGTTMGFEVVPCSFSKEKTSIYETAPQPLSSFSFIYKNDNQGSGSANTGFFTHVRQGALGLSSFTLDTPVPNEIIAVNIQDINNTDVWLWQLDKNGNYSTLWSPIDTISGGSNVIYNSLNQNLRTIYSISTRENDQIDLNFADGVFGDLPKGNFRLFYRQSNGNSYVIKPEQMSGITIRVPYKNPSGQLHTLNLTLSLQYTISNSAPTESNSSIQKKAPQVYYTQDRMITGEDYNIFPLKAGSDILKVKSINRISSGLSKYFDISDVTGKYSRTNIFAADGILYREQKENVFEFEFSNRNQILGIITNSLSPIIASSEIESFYIENYSKFSLASLSLTWNEVNKLPSESRGYIGSAYGVNAVGIYSRSNLQYVLAGSLVKFLPPSGKYFDYKNNLKSIPVSGIPTGGKTYIWAVVKNVINDGVGDGLGLLSDGTGPIIFGTRVPQGAIPNLVIPRYTKSLGFSIENEIANICTTKSNFGLTINDTTRNWDIILNSNLNLSNSFSLNNQANYEDLGLDASWLISFVWTGKSYRVTYRTLNYIFQSVEETGFFLDKTAINYDYTSGTVIKDKIDVLSINSKPNSTTNLGVDYSWQINNQIIELDGYVDPKKVYISFYKNSVTGQINDPESFDQIVGSEFVYFKKQSDSTYILTDDDINPLFSEDDFNSLDKVGIPDNTLYYFYNSSVDVVKYWNTTTASLIYTDEYIGKQGRSDLKFHYMHNSGEERRIDPSKSNIIDIYVLTTAYDNDYRSWVIGNLSAEPAAPTSQSLEESYRPSLEPKKAISDEMIFHPVKYKLLFGSKADVNLQAKFKAVKNSNLPVTDNDLKTRIMMAIDEFFSLENWDFGQSFYFSELATYVMNKLTPDITNFVIVPVGDFSFGSLYEVSCLPDEIFVNGASVFDIEIIDAITASQLKIASSIITNSGS